MRSFVFALLLLTVCILSPAQASIQVSISGTGTDAPSLAPEGSYFWSFWGSIGTNEEDPFNLFIEWDLYKKNGSQWDLLKKYQLTVPDLNKYTPSPQFEFDNKSFPNLLEGEYQFRYRYRPNYEGWTEEQIKAMEIYLEGSGP